MSLFHLGIGKHSGANCIKQPRFFTEVRRASECPQAKGPHAQSRVDGNPADAQKGWPGLKHHD